MKNDYNIAWEVTEACNQACFYCYNFWRGSSIPITANGSCLDHQKVADKLIEMQPISVALTGGEPLLVFNEIKHCITRFVEEGIFVRLLTNGSLINDEIASFLAQNHIQTMVSFPSFDVEQFESITSTNHCSDVVRGLDLLNKHNCDTMVNVVVSTKNLSNMNAIAEFLIQRYGYKTLYFSRATRPHNASKELCSQLLSNAQLQVFFNNCLEIQKQHQVEIRTCGGYAYCAIENKDALSLFAKGCGGGRSSFVISNNGDLRVCGKDSQVFGNIFSECADQIMARASFWTEDVSIPEACAQCRHKHSCRGGCHMSAHEDTPKFNSLDYNAVPSCAPNGVTFRSKHISISFFQQYALSKAVNFAKTENGNRFSFMFLCVYLPDRLASVLLRGERISLPRMALLTGYSLRHSKQLLQEMIEKRIITEQPYA